MNTLLAVAFLAVTLLAAGVFMGNILRAIRGAPRSGCPRCGYGGRPTADRACTECGRLIDQATQAWWRHLVFRMLVALVVGIAAALASFIAIDGVAALPSAVLLRLADPFPDPQTAAGSIAAQANIELHDRIIRGELSNERLEPLLIQGLGTAIETDRLFVHRTAWPTNEPVRIALNRETLNELRSGAKLELALIAPDGEERIATSWGGISRTFARPGESWTWRDPTIALPESVRNGDSVRFAVLLRRGDGSEALRRDVVLPIARIASAGEAISAVDDPALLARLRKALRVRFSPVPREGRPNACAIAWLDPPVDLGNESTSNARAIGLRITIDHLEDPPVHLEEVVLVRDLGGVLTPTQTAPLSFEASPMPTRLGRCRIRVVGDAPASLRSLRDARYLSGEVEFELDLSAQ